MFDDNDNQQQQTNQQPQSNATPKKSRLFRDDFDENEVVGKSYDDFVKIYAKKRGVPYKVVRQLIRFESNDRDDATSDAGAEGRAQMMPETSKRLGVDPRNKWEAAVGAVHYLEDEYKSLRPKAKDDLHGWHAATAAYLAGGGRIAKALKDGKYLPDGDDDKDVYTGLPIANYVENIFNAAGGSEGYNVDDDTPQEEQTQPAPSNAQESVSEEDWKEDRDSSGNRILVNQKTGDQLTKDGSIGKTKDGVTTPVSGAEQRQLIIDEFGEDSPQAKEYDRLMGGTSAISPGSQRLLSDTQKGLVKTEEDYAREEQYRREEAIKQNERQLDEVHREAYAAYRLTGRRADYDDKLKKTFVGSFTVQVAPTETGTQYQIDGKPVDAATASEYAVRQLAGQFTRDTAAIESVVQDYKLRGGGQVRLFDADSGKALDDSKELKNYTIKLPADVALHLRRTNKSLSEKEESEAWRKYRGEEEVVVNGRRVVRSAGSSANTLAFTNGLANSLSFNGLAQVGVGNIIGAFADDNAQREGGKPTWQEIADGLKTLGLDTTSGSYNQINPEMFGFHQGMKTYNDAADNIFAFQMSGMIAAEAIKLMAGASALSRVGNVVAKGAMKGFNRVIPRLVRIGSKGEITAATGSVMGAEAFTSTAALTGSLSRGAQIASKMIGNTTAFAGLQVIAPEGWVVNTDQYGKLLGLERGVVDLKTGKVSKETWTNLAQNFGKHWQALALFSALDMGVTSRVAAKINNQKVQRFMSAVLQGKGYSPEEAIRITSQTLSPAIIKQLSTATSSFAYTAGSNPQAVAGLLNGDRRSIIEFSSDYLMNLAVMGAMKRAHAGLQIRDPRTGKVYEFNKTNRGVVVEEVTGSRLGVDVVEPDTKIELDFLTKNYVDNYGNEAQKQKAAEAFYQIYVNPKKATEDASTPQAVEAQEKVSVETQQNLIETSDRVSEFFDSYRTAQETSEVQEHDPAALLQVGHEAQRNRSYDETLDEMYEAELSQQKKKSPIDFEVKDSPKNVDSSAQKSAQNQESLSDDYSFLAGKEKPQTDEDYIASLTPEEASRLYDESFKNYRELLDSGGDEAQIERARLYTLALRDRANSESKVAGLKAPATEATTVDSGTNTRQIADSFADPAQSKTIRTAPTDGSSVRRQFDGRTYELTPEQARQFDEAARERDEIIRVADNAPAEAHLEQRTSSKGATYSRWIDNKTGEEIPAGTPPPDALRRSLARRQANLAFTQRLNQILGKQSDESLRTNSSTKTAATTNAVNRPGSDFSGRVESESVTDRTVDSTVDADGTGRAGAGDAGDVESRGDVRGAAPETSGKRRVTLAGKVFETTGRRLEEDGVEKVEVRDAQGRRFYVDSDLVNESNPLNRREELPVNEELKKEAEEYAASKGLKYSAGEYFNPDEGTLRELGELMEDLPHEPNNPEVQKAYNALKKETLDQWSFLTNRGVKFEPWTKEGQPYANSKEMREDVVNNRHLYFFTGGDMDASHPLKDASGLNVNGVDLTYNDVFRAVHDYFGHAVSGAQFGARGEFNATDSHARMYSPDAARAMVGETVFQNSYVNYGRHLRRADGSIPQKGDPDYIHPADRPYAPQKALNITPEWMAKWKSAYGDRREAAPLARQQSLFDLESTEPSKLRKIRDEFRQAVTRFRIGYETYDAYVSGKGFVQSGDNHIFYDTERSYELAKASVRASQEGSVDYVIPYRDAGAVTLTPEYANAVGEHVGGVLGAVLRSAKKPLALVNFESASRAINYAHETAHVLTVPLAIGDKQLDSLESGDSFKKLREELEGSSYKDVSTYQLAQEALAFAVTGDAKTFGKNLSDGVLKQAAKEVFKAFQEANPKVPVGELKKLALGIGRDVVKDFQAAERTARSLGEKVTQDFLLRRSEQLKDVPQEVFDDASKLDRQEFIEKYRGAYPYSTRKAILDTLPPPEEKVNPRIADDRRVWNLDHYSREKRTELSPEFAGTANAGKEKLRLDRQKVTYFYLEGTKPETIFNGYVKHHASEELNIYDLSADKLNLRDRFSSDASQIENYLKQNGFDGYWSPERDADTTYRNIVAVFKPMKVEPLFRRESESLPMSEQEAESFIRNGDYVLLSGNQSVKQSQKDVARTASLKKELERKGFEVYEAQGNYLQTRENSLMVVVRNKEERDLLSAIAGAYKQKQIFSAQSGKYTAPFSDGTERENYSKTNEVLFGARALKQDGYTKVRIGNQDIAFSIPDLYSKDRAAKYSATRNEIADAFANQQKFFHKKELSWHLMEAIEKGVVKGGNLADSLENLEAYYQKIHPMRSGTSSEKMARYTDDITRTLRKIHEAGLYNQDWYSDDLKQMFDNMKEEFPGIDENKAAQQVFGLMLAVSSQRTKVTGNFNAAAKIFTEFLKTLQVPTHQPGKLNKKGEPMTYGIFTDALVSANKLLSGHIVVPTKNGFDWKASPEFKRDISQRGMQAIFDYLAKPSAGSQKDRDFISQEIFGMKIGSFLLNLNGEAYIPTIDSWIMRTWNVINGGTVLKDAAGKYRLKKGKKQTNDSPSDALGDALRGAYQSAAKKLSDEGYSITPVEAQALMWMHYKAMLNKLQRTGENEKSTYSESSEYVLGNDTANELGGNLKRFTPAFGTQDGTVERNLGEDMYLRKPSTKYRAFFRSEQDGEAAQHEDLREKIFYSQLSRTIETRLSEKFTKQQLVGLVENTQYGIKKDELVWSGFDSLLSKDSKTLTKQEVLEHISNNRVKIYEKQSKLNNPDFDELELQRLENSYKENLSRVQPIQSKFNNLLDKWMLQVDGMEPGSQQRKESRRLIEAVMGFEDDGNYKNLERRLDSLGLTMELIPDEVANILPVFGEAVSLREKSRKDFLDYRSSEHTGDFDSQYGKYTTDAGKDYREILIKAAGIDTSSKHYAGEEHIIATARIKTLEQDGKRVLMVEEIQSDNAQQLRKDKELLFKSLVEGMKSKGVLEVKC